MMTEFFFHALRLDYETYVIAVHKFYGKMFLKHCHYMHVRVKPDLRRFLQVQIYEDATDCAASQLPVRYSQ